MAEMRGILESPQDFGRAVAEIRLANGMNQRELAAGLGVSQRYLSELELGKPKILDERYLRIIRAMGIRLSFTAEVPDAV